MNYLDKLAKTIKCRRRNQKISDQLSFVLGATVGGAVMILLTKCYCKAIRNVTAKNAQDTNGDIDEEINIKRDEIRQTLEKVDDECIGDVGVAIEKALEDLQDEKQNESELAK